MTTSLIVVSCVLSLLVMFLLWLCKRLFAGTPGNTTALKFLLAGYTGLLIIFCVSLIGACWYFLESYFGN